MKPMEIVARSRDTNRLTSSEWITKIFDSFIELHGDRCYADDPAVIGGIAQLGELAVTVIGMEKGHSLPENIAHNFGQVHPEGYRKSQRLMKQAEKFKRPVVTFINTAGAFCGTTAEERGIGEAIASNLQLMSHLKVPIIAILMGEGGSGGALALAVANEVWVMEYAMYSILSPEGFASILWKDSSRVEEASELMKFTSKDLLAQGMVDQQIAEHQLTEAEIAESIRNLLIERLAHWQSYTTSEIIEARLKRFRNY